MDFAHSLCRLTGSVGLENELVVLENRRALWGTYSDARACFIEWLKSSIVTKSRPVFLTTNGLTFNAS